MSFRIHSDALFPHVSSRSGACMCNDACCQGPGGCICKACSGAGHVGCPGARRTEAKAAKLSAAGLPVPKPRARQPQPTRAVTVPV